MFWFCEIISHAYDFSNMMSYTSISGCDIIYESGYDIIVRYPIQRRYCDIQYKDVTVACTTEMPLPIETVKAQLKPQGLGVQVCSNCW